MIAIAFLLLLVLTAGQAPVSQEVLPLDTEPLKAYSSIERYHISLDYASGMTFRVHITDNAIYQMTAKVKVTSGKVFFHVLANVGNAVEVWHPVNDVVLIKATDVRLKGDTLGLARDFMIQMVGLHTPVSTLDFEFQLDGPTLFLDSANVIHFQSSNGSQVNLMALGSEVSQVGATSSESSLIWLVVGGAGLVATAWWLAVQGPKWTKKSYQAYV